MVSILKKHKIVWFAKIGTFLGLLCLFWALWKPDNVHLSADIFSTKFGNKLNVRRFFEKRKSNSPPQCLPGVDQRLYYLKIYKTGSSSVTNILQRRSLANDLRYPWLRVFDSFPSTDMNKFLVPLSKMQSYIANESSASIEQFTFSREEAIKDNQCQLIDFHSVFNETAVKEVLGPGAVFMVSLRHPLSHLLSCMSYFKLWEKMQIFNRKSNSTLGLVSEYLQNPDLYHANFPDMYHVLNHSISVSKNFFAYSFGWGTFYKDKETFLSEIVKKFSVFVILERLHESLVLAKRKLCWTLKDIIYIKMNVQRKKDTPKNAKKINTLMGSHRKWSPLDYDIYDVFLKKFKRELEKEGTDLQDEVVVYERMLEKVGKFCNQIYETVETKKNLNKLISQSYIEISQSDFNEGFTVHAEDCLIMVLRTNLFRGMLANRKYPKLCDIQPPTKKFQLEWIQRYCPSETKNPLMSSNKFEMLAQPDTWMLHPNPNWYKHV